jgi:hypothetical protein
LAELAQLPEQITECRNERRDLAVSIHGLLSEIASLYRTLYSPVQAFIDDHAIARNAFRLRFTASIADHGFEGLFLEWINRGRAGSFNGTEQGAQRVRELLAQFDFNDPVQSATFAEEVLDKLHNDCRAGGRAPIHLEDQLRANRTQEALLDFLFGFSYLEPRYELKMGDRDLHQLSPGEKGALLLVFYLLVDRNDTPLLIDQPEENLDNQTIVYLLVPSIKEAKRRRQIIMVTHNPNLAVVCDAQQVICALRQSQGSAEIGYTAGAIENPEINRRIIDVLEGTRPAFDNRSGKYLT